LYSLPGWDRGDQAELPLPRTDWRRDLLSAFRQMVRCNRGGRGAGRNAVRGSWRSFASDEGRIREAVVLSRYSHFVCGCSSTAKRMPAPWASPRPQTLSVFNRLARHWRPKGVAPESVRPPPCWQLASRRTSQGKGQAEHPIGAQGPFGSRPLIALFSEGELGEIPRSKHRSRPTRTPAHRPHSRQIGPSSWWRCKIAYSGKNMRCVAG
jgi:hypothetical protein